MNRPTFEKTVDILVKAYLNDTLVHGACTACAVGNIIADCTGKIPVRDKSSITGFMNYKWNDGSHAQWNDVFSTCLGESQRIRPDNYTDEAKQQIDSTGYTWQELARIEFAFESAPGGVSSLNNYQDETWMFNGLMAVVNVLAEIHGIDLKQREEAKLLFVK